MDTKKYLRNMLSVSGLVAIASVGHAITINVDGVNHTTLSSAVAAAHLAEDGPDVINLMVDSMPTSDSLQILINKPLVINGDGNGNNIPCDILANIAEMIEPVPDAGNPLRSYIEIQTSGTVEINNLKLHPGSDGLNPGFGNMVGRSISGIRMYYPTDSSDVANYAFTKVYVGGSDSSNNYLPLDTDTSLWEQSGRKRWAGFNGDADVNTGKHAAIHLSDEVTTALGQVSLVLNQCHAGLSRGCGLSLNGANSIVQVNGGVFGHCGRDAIRINGPTVTIQGTQNDRVRVVRATNVEGANSHSIEILGAATVPLIEYADIKGCNTANGFSIREGSQVANIRFCRVLGKFLTPNTDVRNEPLYVTGAGTKVDLFSDCTFHSDGPSPVNIMNLSGSTDQAFNFKDCVFTSANLGSINIGTLGSATFTNCAIPADAVANESLSSPPFIGTGIHTEISPVGVSPVYLLNDSVYDWSDAQGAADINNGIGNRNVLRPSSASYNSASSVGGVLFGGAGPVPNAGISADVWMLM